MIVAVRDDDRIRFVREDEFDTALASLDNAETRIFEIPVGIATKFDFFTAARLNLPLDPPLGFHYRNPNGEYEESWDALSDSLWGGVLSVKEPRVVIAWRDPSSLESADGGAGRTAVDILLSLPADADDAAITGGERRTVVILLGSR
jgi:hypothetical protein